MYPKECIAGFLMVLGRPENKETFKIKSNFNANFPSDILIRIETLPQIIIGTDPENPKFSYLFSFCVVSGIQEICEQSLHCKATSSHGNSSVLYKPSG